MQIAVLGAGTSGLIAALSLRRHLPTAAITIIHDPVIETIGVGEGTTPNFLNFMFKTLQISRSDFYAKVRPTWKLGINYEWGARDHFIYSFSGQFDGQINEEMLPNGFFCIDRCDSLTIASTLAEHRKVFPRGEDNIPIICERDHAFHIENRLLIDFLRAVAKARGIGFLETGFISAVNAKDRLASLRLDNGMLFEADLFIDASGFRSELLGGTLKEPFKAFDDMLFCNKAIVGGWKRDDEPILPFTTSQQMKAGWCWQIEHEHLINRGYVFSDSHISEEEAINEFLEANPKCTETRTVGFRSGCHERFWVKNVVAVGNAAGFVEPLEATAIMANTIQADYLGGLLSQCGGLFNDATRMIYNRSIGDVWLEIRDFLALHYKVNLAADTPFWNQCNKEIVIPDLEDFLLAYGMCGPTGYLRSLLPRDNLFGLDGYLAILIGNNWPHQGAKPAQDQVLAVDHHRSRMKQIASTGFDVREALQYVHHPNWVWFEDQKPS